MLFREFATPIPASGPLDTAADVIKMMGKMALGMVREGWAATAANDPSPGLVA